MAFEEPVREQAKRRGNYRCSTCQRHHVHVQYLAPPSAGGTEEIENAIPLCAFCHHRHGDDPGLRERLREMRDAWWVRCERIREESGLIELNQALDRLRADYFSEATPGADRVGELRDLLRHTLEYIEAELTRAATLSELVAAAAAVSGSLDFFPCQACGYSVPSGTQTCSNCHSHVRVMI